MKIKKSMFVRIKINHFFILFIINYFYFYYYYFLKNEEVKRAIDLLNDELSDHISILQDLYKLLKKSLIIFFL